MGRIFVLTGPPGSGKGTQADKLAERFGMIHFDMGGALREEIESGSELGERIASFVDEGKLVPLDIIEKFVRTFFARNEEQDIILDGFPRSLEQAEVLDRVVASNDDLQLEAVFDFDVDKETLRERVVNRRIGENGEVYNLKTDPPPEDVEVHQREDDTEEVFEERYEEQYVNSVVPVIEHYRKQDTVEEIDADRGIEEIFEELEGRIAQG